MPAPLRCPTCSAPMEAPEPHATTARCTYCGATALLSERGGGTDAVASHDRHATAVAEVLEHLRAGDRIGAVRVYRERFGVGLREAVTAVERIEAGQPAGSIPPRKRSRAGVGCSVVFALVVLGAGLAVPWSGTRDADPPAPPAARTRTEPASPAAPPAAPAFAEPVLRFGAEGTGAGRFQDARGVAVDGAGRIYVAEYTGGRVQVFDSAGTFVTQWMADPRMPLVDLEADRDGTVYVVQSGRIRRYEGATGRALGEVPRPDRTSFGDVAVALDGSLWAAAGFTQLLHLSRDGRVRRTLDLSRVVDEDARPTRVAVAGTGDVYVLDRWSGQVYHLSPEGRFVDRFGGRGEGGESTRSPEDVAIDGRGRVYVSDLGAGIRVYDAGGRFVDSFAASTVVFGIAFNDRDDLFAAHRNEHQIVRYRISGNRE